ncbi:fungal-specific transcription factor domain-containing protein [Microdochium trichocladiopsis]|uniref:Fungal-specific transcription factor domain-containing protein n=1 Tax=Microdochium trichocladiopsis TaxID=1682393 RepID=A0A9P8Y336_9PEZI|nr:fungal-specific transcription factor domain-containing protein [Microdochium trichocladiopsis]KAH7028201.1 fungal-specific transcription factor domain-containing protein [Microdochium trichocladiopsis]
MQSHSTRQISCKRCQKRKIKCSRTFPCVNCTTTGVPCEFRNDGARKFPISRDYVESLETQVANFEHFLAQLKATPAGRQRDAMIDDLQLTDHHDQSSQHASSANDSQPGREVEVGHGHLVDRTMSERTSPASWNDQAVLLPGGMDANLVYHGPTSIYSGVLGTSETETRHSQGENASELIALFFRWQYPQFMFIDREAFILDFRTGTFGGQFCSSALVHAISSIGALMTPPSPGSAAASSATVCGEESRNHAEAATRILLGPGLSTPHTTSVQALLCCGFYEIGQGNFSQGWLYSGMAFRMGQDLGFQRDPGVWERFRSPENDPLALQKEFHRRIYWGCYISDKFFSLFLGRPCFMHELDSDVEPSRPKPQEPIFRDWLLERGLGHLHEQTPVVPKYTLVFNKQIEIGTIIREGLTMLYSPKRWSTTGDQPANLSLSTINAKLLRFKEHLPAEMRLKEWTSLSELVPPHLAVMHVLYHSTLIAFNRPFLHIGQPRPTEEPSSISRSSGSSEPAHMCIESAERILHILKRFKAQHELRNAPLTLVHGAISAVSALLAVYSLRGGPGMQQLGDQSTAANLETATQSGAVHDNTTTLVNAFSMLLGDLQSTWPIAGKALQRLNKVVRTNGKEMSTPSNPISTFHQEDAIGLDNFHDFIWGSSLISGENLGNNDISI